MIGELKFDIAPERKSNRQQRFEMVQYAAEHGISAAARKFNTTRKTVRMWLNRYRREGEEGLSNISHRYRKKRLAGSDQIRDAKRNEQRCLELSSERISELINLQYRQNHGYRSDIGQTRHALDNRNAGLRQMSSFSTVTEDSTIQFDVLSLKKIDHYGDRCGKYNLPCYQYTACHKQSGAVWIAFAYKNTLAQKLEFWQVLRNHLKNCGLNVEGISVECRFDDPSARDDNDGRSSELIQAVEENFARCCIYPREKDSFAGIENFHRHITREIYSAVNIRTVRGLLKKVNKYIIGYNYHSRHGVSSGLPPYQLFCRSADCLCRENILAMSSEILDSYSRTGNGLGTVLNPLRSVLNFISKSENNGDTAESAVQSGLPRPRPATAPAGHKMSNMREFEFINLKAVEWNQAASNHSPADRIGRNHHRREIIDRARLMLEQKRTPDNLRGDLPLTEGELALLNQKISMDRQVRNR
jgi:transposase